MALIKCEDCEKEISDKAAACVHCGCPIEKTLSEPEKIPVVAESVKYDFTKRSNDESELAGKQKTKNLKPYYIVGAVTTVALFIVAIILSSNDESEQAEPPFYLTEPASQEFYETVDLTVTIRYDIVELLSENGIQFDSVSFFDWEWQEGISGSVSLDLDISTDTFVDDSYSIIIIVRDYFIEHDLDVERFRVSLNDGTENVQEGRDSLHYISTNDFVTFTVFPPLEGDLVFTRLTLEQLANTDITIRERRESPSATDTSADELESTLIEAATVSETLSFDSFQELALSPSYDELFRFPETYQDSPIRITVSITDATPDSWGGLLQGGYRAMMGSEEVVLFDGRDVREPRLRVGDTATIYGHGDGLYRMQTRERGLIRGRVIDEWYVPRVRILFVEIE